MTPNGWKKKFERRYAEDSARRAGLMRRYWVQALDESPSEEELRFMWSMGAECILYFHETQGPSWGFFSSAGGHGKLKGLTFHSGYGTIGTRTDPGTPPSS